MVTVIARYRVRAGNSDSVRDVLARHVTATRQEPGCERFQAFRAVDGGDEFVLVEQYTDEAAFAAHRQSAHFRENIENTVAPLLAERIWHRCEEISGD